MIHIKNCPRQSICFWALIIASGTFGYAQDRPNETTLTSDSYVDVVSRPDAQRVDVLVGGDLFTAYLYTDTLAALKKPVLFPIRAASGSGITRGFPLEDRPGERTDHPHQLGYWFNYGDVNGLDFWNNSDAIPLERADDMGTIRHQEIIHSENGEGKGELSVIMNWTQSDGKALLREETQFVFYATSDVRIIDRISSLTALDARVDFDDNKEGLLGLRVTRALEMPTTSPVTLTDASGRATEVPVMDNEGVTGHYRNSEGIEGYPDVWGKRARWMTLSGVVDGDSVTVAILDHPQNVGFPTCWHARDYGLFAANPLGQEVFSEGKESLYFSLEPGESTIFRYRLAIIPGSPASAEIEKIYEDFRNE